MKDRRGKIILLLFLLINLTACQTWKATSIQSITADQPDLVRAVFRDLDNTSADRSTRRWPLELEAPSVDGDELVGLSDARMFRVPLADIAYIEVGEFSFSKTVGVGALGYLAAVLIACAMGQCN